MPTFDIQQVETCSATGFQTASVCVPVTIIPFVRAGTITTYSYGEPVIVPGETVSPGTPNGTCSFTVTQSICTAVPLQFGATATIGTMNVLYGVPTCEEVCQINYETE